MDAYIAMMDKRITTIVRDVAAFFAYDGPRFLRKHAITLLFAAADRLERLHIRSRNLKG